MAFGHAGIRIGLSVASAHGAIFAGTHSESVDPGRVDTGRLPGIAFTQKKSGKTQQSEEGEFRHIRLAKSLLGDLILAYKRQIFFHPAPT